MGDNVYLKIISDGEAQYFANQEIYVECILSEFYHAKQPGKALTELKHNQPVTAEEYEAAHQYNECVNVELDFDKNCINIEADGNSLLIENADSIEELIPQIGSIIRTVNGEAVRFELTDEERNGIWDMVEQQNVEDHFRELICENGYDTSSSGMDKIIAEMAAKYRDDFGYGNDDEFLGYISERDDDIKELHYFGIFGDVYVDKNDVSDYTGRIMIIRPEYFSPRNCTPEEQLFLAQSGSGCNPKEYGGMINGVFLYDREEAAIPSDIFLGAMKP